MTSVFNTQIVLGCVSVFLPGVEDRSALMSAVIPVEEQSVLLAAEPSRLGCGSCKSPPTLV